MDWIPPEIEISDSGGLDLEAWCLDAWMPGCWQDWRGLEEMGKVTARWGEGIGTNFHMLEPQELGGCTSSGKDHVSICCSQLYVKYTI